MLYQGIWQHQQIILERNMIFWIGFTLMVLNEGFVMMRHVSPFFDNQERR